MKIPKIPDIKDEECTPTILKLLEIVQYQSETIQVLKDEIAVLKGDKKKPKIEANNLDKNYDKDPDKKKDSEKRKGSDKKSKKKLKINKTIKCPPCNVPKGSRFKGYKDFIVQGITIKSHNVCYKLERWLTPDGQYVNGKLPKEINGHFSPTLISYIQYQYYQCHVTQPLLLEQLREFGIDISAGQINNIIIEGNSLFHEEKNDVLDAGLKSFSYVNVDDTGANHKGKRGYCTHIGNDFFAWFSSKSSKSRINFITLLQSKDKGLFLNEYSFKYIKRQRVSEKSISAIKGSLRKVFSNNEDIKNHLKCLGINKEYHIRIIIEGALLGHLFENGLDRNFIIVSDDAGQFNISQHALCWVHTERLVHKLVPRTENQRSILKDTLDCIWELYKGLKEYKIFPTSRAKAELSEKFDFIFKEKTGYMTLDILLKRLSSRKKELLLVLERPDIPLHNNLSESDIREYVKKRKISGGTRSDNGRDSRDTFASLKKTARKLKISFWKYLIDRNHRFNLIPQLGDLVRQYSCGTS